MVVGPPAHRARLLAQDPCFCQMTPQPGGSKRALFFFLKCSFLREKQIHIPPTRVSWVSDFSSAFRSCVACCLGRQELPGRGRRGLSHPAPPQCWGRAEPAPRPAQLPRPGCLIPGRDPGPLTGQPTEAWIMHPCLRGCCDIWARVGPRPVGPLCASGCCLQQLRGEPLFPHGPLPSAFSGQLR